MFKDLRFTGVALPQLHDLPPHPPQEQGLPTGQRGRQKLRMQIGEMDRGRELGAGNWARATWQGRQRQWQCLGIRYEVLMSADALAGMRRIFLSFSEFKTFLQLNSQEGGGPLKNFSLTKLIIWPLG